MANREIYMENTSLNEKTGKNHSKFYYMVETSNTQWAARSGRIGCKGRIVKVYNVNDWEKMRRQKERKGYNLLIATPGDFYVPDLLKQLHGGIQDKLRNLASKLDRIQDPDYFDEAENLRFIADEMDETGKISKKDMALANTYQKLLK